MDNPPTTTQPPRRHRRRSSAPDAARQFLGWAPWEPAAAPDALDASNPWNSDTTVDSKQQQLDSAAATAEDLAGLGITHARRRSSDPSPNATLRGLQMWKNRAKGSNEDDAVEYDDEEEFKETSPTTSPRTRFRRTSSNPDLDPEKLNMEYLDDSSTDLPSISRARARRRSSRISRSKSMELGASFSSTVEKVVSHVLDDEESPDARKSSKPAPTSGIRAKRTSTQFQGYNQLCEFDMLEAEDLPLEILRDLESEACPFCGSTILENKKYSTGKACYVVMFCRRLGCRHTAHNSCINESTIKQLIPIHNSNWFIVRSQANKLLDRMSQTLTKETFHVHVQISHLVSDIAFASFNTSKPVASFMKEHIYGTAIEMLQVAPQDFSVPVLGFSISRARIQVSVSDSHKTSKMCLFDGNFDLSGCQNAINGKFSLVCSNGLTKQIVYVHVSRILSPDRIPFWKISSVEVELSEPKVAYQSKLTAKASKEEVYEKSLSAASSPTRSERKLLGAVIEEKREFLSEVKTDELEPMNSVSPLPSPKPHEIDPEMYKELQELLKTSGNSASSSFETPSVETILPLLPGNILKLARTQVGSRFLQEQIRDVGMDFINFILPEVFEHISDLMKDLFGNYMCQILIKACTHEQRLKLLRKLSDQMGSVSCDRQGTRVMQKVIQYSSSPSEMDVIVSALLNHLLPMMFDPHGSYVINALVDQLPFEKMSAIVEVACGSCAELAVNQHGLCVLKKLLTRCVQEDDRRLIAVVLESVPLIVNNQYGNYLVQHVLTLGSENAKRMLHERLQGKYCMLSKQKFSSNVVEKCLSSFEATERSEVVIEFMNEAEIAALLEDSYGNYVMQNALSLTQGKQALDFIAMIRPQLKTLRKKIQKKWESLLNIAEARVKGLPMPMQISEEDSDSGFAARSAGSSPSNESWHGKKGKGNASNDSSQRWQKPSGGAGKKNTSNKSRN